MASFGEVFLTKSLIITKIFVSGFSDGHFLNSLNHYYANPNLMSFQYCLQNLK